MLFYLTHPVLYGLEGFTIVDSISKDYTHSTLVVGLSDGFETLLASSIPDLHLDSFAIHLNCL
jgi:hypothetical protein